MLTDKMIHELQGLGFSQANLDRNGGPLCEPLRSKMVDAAARARASGATMSEICARLNVSRVTLKQLLGASGDESGQPGGRSRGRQRVGCPPRTVEVGMLLCRPRDGWKAAAFRVVASEGPVASVVTRFADGSEALTFDVAIAAILHPDGGWVLAADWTEKTKDGRPR